MAGTNGQFNQISNLSPNQQDLLLAALSSNNPNGKKPSSGAVQSSNGQPYPFDSMDPTMFSMSGQSGMPMGSFNSPLEGLDDSPYVDFLDGPDSTFNFDLPDEEGEMIGDLPGADELHDKRKSPEDNADDSHDGKRREGEDKTTAKKPGRKPLTSEPTSKRKAQNRAAQRAFRERKEQHLKDLETKVGELEKSSESANHENGLLKAQVERLQIELREYRKRLSLNNSSSLNRSPPTGSNSLNFLSNQSNGNSANNFQFEFPRFGSLPTTAFNNVISPKASSPPATNVSAGSNTAPGVLARNDSTARSVSPRSQARMNGSMSSVTSPAVNSPNSINGTSTPLMASDMANIFGSTFNGLGSVASVDYNSFLPTTTAEPQSFSSDTQSQSGQSSRIFQFNSASVSSDSPGSSSSISQYGGPNSSCGTSPEPSHNSPSFGNKDATLDTINEIGNVEGAASSSTQTPNVTSTNVNNMEDSMKSFDWFAQQNGGTFDPQLFGDYREPQNAIVGDGDFTGGFFNDAMPTMDFSSPFNWADLTAPTGFTPAVQKMNPLEQADALQAGLDSVEEEVVPGENPDQQLSCHKIWDKLQERDDFKDGTLDIDGLCSELRAKARCSESGVVIDQKDVESALKRMPASRTNSNPTLA